MDRYKFFFVHFNLIIFGNSAWIDVGNMSVEYSKNKTVMTVYCVGGSGSFYRGNTLEFTVLLSSRRVAETTARKRVTGVKRDTDVLNARLRVPLGDGC